MSASRTKSGRPSRDGELFDMPLKESVAAAPVPGRLTVERLSSWPPSTEATGSLRHELDAFLLSVEGQRLGGFLAERIKQGATIFPPGPFRALELTPLESVRIVILGQDPYHGPGQAHGLAFSVPDGVPIPPSLRNILAELQRDLGVPMRRSGSLETWAKQGVLLLNTCLTVEEGRPASHAGKGWDVLIGRILHAIVARSHPTVFMLWGAHAQSWRPIVDAGDGCRLILTCNHPSPLSARRPPKPFIGCGHFGQATRYLEQHGAGSLNW